MSKDLNYRDFLCRHECVVSIERLCPCPPQPCCCPCCRPCCPPPYPPHPPYPPYPPYPPHPLRPPLFLSGYMEALGCGQSKDAGELFVFEKDSIDDAGNIATLDDTGTIFTINRTGIYHVEWNVNLASGPSSQEPAVIGIVEGGEYASGAASSTHGNFSSGTVIYVDKVPFTISLINHAGQIAIEDHPQYENSAASIRIVRVSDVLA